MRQIAPPPSGDNGQPSPSTKTVQPDEPLERIRAADEHFDESVFLSGASQAYELVVNAYANGDMSKLNGLLDSDVAAAFHDAIDERREKGDVLTSLSSAFENWTLPTPGSRRIWRKSPFASSASWSWQRTRPTIQLSPVTPPGLSP